MRRISFAVAPFSPSFSRIYPQLPQFRAHPSKVSLRLRTGASLVLRLRPPQAGKQAAERTALPPALHFRISPAYRYIYPQYKTPWGTQRHKPAQGRATFTMGVLRRRHVLSLPLAAGLPPLQEKIGGVYSLRFTALRSGRKPVLHRLKGGRAAPGRRRGSGGRKKRNRPCLRFFLFQGGVLPPPPPHRHSGAYFAHPVFRLAITHSAISPTAGAGEAAFPGRLARCYNLSAITARPPTADRRQSPR
jgi:hypothetical protein